MSSPTPNPLESYFEAHKTGPGIWKWRHYFEIYHRHFQKFRGQPVHVLEIGVYSGGSLGMWKEYFGPHLQLYGVDIEEACLTYQDATTRIFRGDQADPIFWDTFKAEVPLLDIVIDDGGHLPLQQITSLQCLLPHLRPGGVYLCEDVHGEGNGFAAHVQTLIDGLNAFSNPAQDLEHPEKRLMTQATPVQASVHAIHSYPFVTVIEKNTVPVAAFVAPKHGTQWEPFLR